MGLLQNVVIKARELVNAEFGIANEAGINIACSDSAKINNINPFIKDVLSSQNQIDEFEGYTFQKLYVKNRLEYIVFIKGTGKQYANYLSLVSMNILNVKLLSDEKSGKTNFVKTILEGSATEGDIMLKARDFHIACNAGRITYLIKTERQTEAYAYDILQGLFPNRLKDFIVVIDDERVVLVRELKDPNDSSEIERIARTIVDTLNAELMENVYIGIGSAADNLAQLARSYQEANIALTVGRIFESDKNVFKYENLGLGRLIYQLPLDVCNTFLKEVFKEGSFDSLDAETMHTVHSFFENSLNVSLTSRQLFVHRNTLVYRLDKIEKLTGLDLRQFDDAVIFMVAILVRNYIDSMKR